MRQLTIDGKPVVVWFDKVSDLQKSLIEYLEYGYRWSIKLDVTIDILRRDGLNPLICCAIAETEQLLARGVPVLYCFAKPTKLNEGMDPHPQIQQLRHWKIKYPGLAIYGSAEGGASKVPALHSEKFEEYGYS